MRSSLLILLAIGCAPLPVLSADDAAVADSERAPEVSVDSETPPADAPAVAVDAPGADTPPPDAGPAPVDAPPPPPPPPPPPVDVPVTDAGSGPDVVSTPDVPAVEAASCGGSGQRCCNGSECEAALGCIAARCTPCGGTGQTCCPGSTCGSVALGCASSGRCAACGGAGQPCCWGAPASGRCGAGFACNGFPGVCSCGGEHEPCCAGVSACRSRSDGTPLSCRSRGGVASCEL